MFSKGQLIFAIFFVIAFIIVMVYSYRKDIKNHQKYYKNAALKVGIWMVVAVVVWSAIRIYSKQ